jgi:PPOX class probable F420-dependent enzyme
MEAKTERLLRTSKLCYLTTFNAEGKPGTVEIWFVWHNGRIYIDTGPGTLKVQKIRKDPRVRVRVGTRKGPVVEGTARIAEMATVRTAAPVLNAKYREDGNWGDDAEFVKGHGGAKPEYVLLEITPSP